MTLSGRERHPDACPAERLSEPGENRQVGVKLDALKPANAERRKPLVMLQPRELALHGGAAPVEVAPPLRLTAPDHMKDDPHPSSGRRSSGPASTLRRVILPFKGYSGGVPDRAVLTGVRKRA
jgi:hypothetical protein